MQIILILLGACFLYLVQSFLYRHYWDDKLTVTIDFEREHAVCGDDLNLLETVRNQKFLPLPSFEVKFMTARELSFYDHDNSNVSDYFYRDDLISILMYQQVTRTLRFNCKKRGYYRINHADVVCHDLFFSNLMVTHMPVDRFLYVYPKMYEDQAIQAPFQKMLGSLLTKRFYNEDPFEFAGIREYQTYDNIKDINWNASARTGSLKVNVHDYTSSQQVIIFLNLEDQTLLAHDNLVEESIRLAATYANAFIQSGIATAVYTNGCDLLSKEQIIIPAGSGSGHVTKINEGLARIDSSLPMKSFVSFLSEMKEHITSQDYLLFISTYHKMDLQDFLLDLKGKKQDFHFILPLDSQIENKICDALKETTDAFIIPE